MTNRSGVVLYTGVTSSLERRMWFHGNTTAATFVKKYKLDVLAYYEVYSNPSDAIAREKQIKGWRREKKNALVETLNPTRGDLGQRLFERE
jgi:putative endonuclease